MKALITGASSGIGRALAVLLAKDGYDLVLVGRNAGRLDAAREETLAAGAHGVTVVPLDLSVRENCIALHDAHPDVDLLVNNAGFGDIGFFDETPLEKELSMIDTNVAAMHVLFKLYLGTMVRRDRGQILNVASIAGFMPGPLMATYYATKSYVVRLSEGVRKELKEKGAHVKISILCPGPVDTGFKDTAGIRFNFHGVDVDAVARYAYKKVKKGKFYVVPTVPVRLSRFFLKILPSPLISSFIYTAQSGRLK
ncbi:MAG: SDR family oxidoreductase [Clostridia bacterium]|nr:SDR family oxidoreductase [Clostridia bacterium]